MPPALAKNNMAIVTPNMRVAAETVSPVELAAIEAAAGGDKFAAQKIDRTPRLPPQDGQHESAFLSVPFMPGDEKATPEIISRLESEVIPLLQQNPGWRIQIQAFSSPDNEVRSSARRTALSRALSVREYLMAKGIEAPRMDIRALGMETDRDPLDRIDLVFFDPATKS
jgi:outer membrane protein OmpA-like peptidoglycan-associated protein